MKIRSVACLLLALLALAMGATRVQATVTGDPVSDLASDLVRMPAVEVSGFPRSYVTITIQVPEPLRGAARVAFEVRLTGLTDVVGRTEGELVLSQSRRVVLTLRVPSEALVGILDVADVYFLGDDGTEYVVPIMLRIPAVRGFVASGTREFRGLRTGDRVDLLYRVANHGNAPDTLTYRIETPAGWQSRPAGDRVIVVPARGQVELPATVTIPAFANIGDHTVGLAVAAVRDSVRTQHLSTTLGVTGALGRNTTGLTLRPTVAAATSRAGTATFWGAALEGLVAQDVHLNARFAPTSRQNGIVSQGLNAVGAIGMPFSAAMTGRDWNVTAGNVGTPGSDLTGANIYGQGLSGFKNNERFGTRVLLARPGAGTTAEGQYIGLGYSRQTRVGRIGGSVARLEERGVFATGRDLTAVGAEYTSGAFGTLVAGGSLAYRASESATGIGVGVRLDHERDGERASFRFTHAPGGSSAFARAVNEFQLSGSRVMSEKWSMDAMLLQTRDAGAVFSRMDSRSLSLGQRYQIVPAGAVFLRAQSSRFDAATATSSIGGFGADEHSLTAGADWRLGEYSLNAEVAQGFVVRRSDLLDGRVSETASSQTGIRADASRDFEHVGNIALGAEVQLTEAGVGVPSQVWTLNASWAGAPMLVVGRPVRLTSSANYQQFAGLSGMITAAAGMTMALPSGLDLAVSLERNPFFRDLQGRAGMIAAMSLTASTRVFSPTVLGPEGMVFEDLNQNGRHDVTEPGVAGVAVRRGTSRAVSDRRGLYRLPAAARGRTVVETATIPMGLVAHPMLGSDSLEMRDVPLLATGSVLVELTLAADAEGRVPTVDLSTAIVMLKDATGFEWVGRRTGATTAVFSGIPTGKYALRLDLSTLREPLRSDDGVTVDVTPHDRAKLVVPLRGRTVRYTTPPSRSGTPGRGAGRGGAK